jgi:hypothetical protein
MKERLQSNTPVPLAEQELFTLPEHPENNVVRRVWRYQRLNQNPKIEVHTTQWPKEKGQSTVYKTIHIKLNIEQHGHIEEDFSDCLEFHH